VVDRYPATRTVGGWRRGDVVAWIGLPRDQTRIATNVGPGSSDRPPALKPSAVVKHKNAVVSAEAVPGNRRNRGQVRSRGFSLAPAIGALHASVVARYCRCIRFCAPSIGIGFCFETDAAVVRASQSANDQKSKDPRGRPSVHDEKQSMLSVAPQVIGSTTTGPRACRRPPLGESRQVPFSLHRIAPATCLTTGYFANHIHLHNQTSLLPCD
jgi:hypothetical protein